MYANYVPVAAVRADCNLVLSQQKCIFFYSSVGQKSEISMAELKSRCPQDYALFRRLWERSHILFFPSSALGDCQHFVVCDGITRFSVCIAPPPAAALMQTQL